LGRYIQCINLVILFLDVEDFLIPEEDVFVPVLGVPLEETFCSCPSDFFQSGSKECPFERRGALMFRSSLMRHDLIGSLRSAFRKLSSVSRVYFGESAPIPF